MQIPPTSQTGLASADQLRTTAWAEIPAGSFEMGGVEGDKFVSAVEIPRHSVSIARSFLIGRLPVTCAEWLRVTGILPAASAGAAPDTPVVGVTWHDALAYCGMLSAREGALHRLPTEAEWEYVCRGGSSTIFPHGNNLSPEQANYFYDEFGRAVGTGRIAAAGRYGHNAYGVADLLGNVCEWTADLWHPGFTGAPSDGSAWLEKGYPGRRVIRGGAWDHLPRVLRCSWRDWAHESSRWDNLGFRLVKEVITL